MLGRVDFLRGVVGGRGRGRGRGWGWLGGRMGLGVRGMGVVGMGGRVGGIIM